MANIVKRIIQLILDKESAEKTQKDIDDVAGHVEKTWKDVAGKIAGYLGVAFLTKKVFEFGKASVEEASKANEAWAQLRGTIEGTGASFEKMQANLEDTAQAFQDATIHDDDAFAESLTRVISLTGDASASLNNMGLVANVAAQFFKGDLGPASDLVAKAMNGNVAALQRMGIHAETAQQALDILSQRSMGAAEREAASFGGQVKQLNNLWDDFQKEVGKAIIGSDGAATALDVLRNVLVSLTEWVVTNKEEIVKWTTEGVNVAIKSADVFIRAVDGMARILGGGFATAIGIAAQGLAILIKGIATVKKIADAPDQLFSKVGIVSKEDAEAMRAGTNFLETQANAIDDWGKKVQALGTNQVAKGIEVLSTPLFSPEDFSGKGKPRAKLASEKNKPVVSGGTLTEEQKNIQKGLEDFEKAGARIAVMEKVLGKNFDGIGAEIDRTTKLLMVMAENGIDPANEDFQHLQGWLKELTVASEPANQTLLALSKTMQADLAIGALTGAKATEVLKLEQNALQKAIRDLIEQGIDPADERLVALSAQLQQVSADMKDAEITEALNETLKELANTLQNDLAMSAVTGSTALDHLKLEQQELQRAIQQMISKGIDPQDARMKKLTDRYKEVTAAINEQTTAMEFQAAAADFLAEAMGAALEGGIAQAASKKARQNAIEAAEMLVRAAAFAIFGDFGHAAGALKLAAEYGAVAVAWAALAASSKGGGGGGTSMPTAPSGAGSAGGTGGSEVSGARRATATAAREATTPSAEVSVYLVGPGFHALNPEVQKVVRGAAQEAGERYGKDARIRIVPQGT